MINQQAVAHFTEVATHTGDKLLQLHILTDADPTHEIHGSISDGDVRFRIYEHGQKAEVTFEGDSTIYSFTRVKCEDPAVMAFEISLIDDT